MKIETNPKFTLTLDSSQIVEFQMCALKWWYHYREHLVLATSDTSAPDMGTLIHSLCDMYYNLRWQMPEGSKLFQMGMAIEMFKDQELTKKLFPLDDGKLEQFLCERFCLYVNRYINDDFILPKAEVSPVELGFSKLLYEDHNVRFIVEGRIDLVNIILGDKMVFTDHKTQSRSGLLYQYKPQFKTYAWATGYEYGMVNYIGMQQKPLPDGKSFHRQIINFPKWMIDEWELKMLSIFWEITNLITDRYIEPFEDKFIEQRIYAIRNDATCAGPFDSNPCQFTHLCELGNYDMKQSLKAFKYNKREWTPWALPKEEVK